MRTSAEKTEVISEGEKTKLELAPLSSSDDHHTMFACLPFLTSSSSSSSKQPIALDWDEKLPQDWTAHSALSGAEKRTREVALQQLIASLEERKLDV